jgi:hypothetical protein
MKQKYSTVGFPAMDLGYNCPHVSRTSSQFISHCNMIIALTGDEMLTLRVVILFNVLKETINNLAFC